MKIAIIAAAVTSLAAIPALADEPGAGWVSRPTLARAIQRQGYQISKVEADDGHWEGEMTKAGKRYEFHAAPRSGRLTKIELKHAHHD